MTISYIQENILNKIIIATAVLALFSLPGNANAGGPGSTSGNFLKMPAGARSAAMGGAMTALPDGPYSAYWNPAALSGIGGAAQAALMHNISFEDITQQYVVYAHPLQNSALAGAISYLSSGKIQGYDESGVRTRSISHYDLAASLTYQRNLLPGFSAGVSGKMIQSKLDNTTAVGYAADLGLYYTPKISGLGFGAALRNIGTEMKYVSEGFALPLSLDLGAAYSTQILGKPLNLGLSAVLPNDNDLFIRAGGELTLLNRMLSLRAGYDSGYDAGSGINAGFGFTWEGITIDYGLREFGDLGYGHIVSLSYSFSSSREDEIKEKAVVINPRLEIKKPVVEAREAEEFILSWSVSPGSQGINNAQIKVDDDKWVDADFLSLHSFQDLKEGNRRLGVKVIASDGGEAVDYLTVRVRRAPETATEPQVEAPGERVVQDETPVSGPVIHKVRTWRNDRESLVNLAIRYYNDPDKWAVIYEANKELLENPNVIHPGMELIIPDID